ncbi:MAG: hypothetical protein II817_12800 [Bacteroidales bacterium]|nr:hypothetical protein [Bacteroidales bacterium]
MTKEEQVYTLIQGKASSNEFLQGLSGILGFPFTLMVDASVIFTHYGPMLNQIRTIYGRKPLNSQVIKPILDGCKSEIIADLVVDKVVGQIPIVGIAANIMCAKTMTWRLGILFGMLAAKGEDFTSENTRNAMIAIRCLFPQKSMVTFTTPSIDIVKKLLCKLEDTSTDDFNTKCCKIIDAV